MIVIGARPAIPSIHDVQRLSTSDGCAHARARYFVGRSNKNRNACEGTFYRQNPTCPGAFSLRCLQEGQIVRGQVHRNRRKPPYWPWLLILREYVRGNDPDNLRTEMGSCVPFIAEIVPELSIALADLKSAPAIDEPSNARLRLFATMLVF